jgi:3-hydroxyacyl-[acyl-carrier-protein] dehydratase
VGSDITKLDPAPIDVEAAIPHRAPFLFVDRVTRIDDDAIVTEWDVKADLPAFRGHYPGNPVLPGVLLSEFTFQSAAILFSDRDATASGAVPVLTRIEDARFRKIVRPGETLVAEVECIERVGAARYVKAKVTSGGETVLKIRFTIALVAASEDAGAP